MNYISISYYGPLWQW